MDASERPWVLDTGSPYGDDEHFIIDSEELETCVATVPFHGPDERDSAEANAELIVKAVNMHDKLVAFVETMKRDCEKRQDTGSCEGCYGTVPGGILCGTRALLKEARGDK